MSPLAGKRQKPSAAPVFVISTGRTGSTLVQRLLNCHRELVIWGEHCGFLNGLTETYQLVVESQQKFIPLSPSANSGPSQLTPTFSQPHARIEWANPWSVAEFKQRLKSFIRGYFGAHLEHGQRWGFKEIRYNSLATLNMLSSLFPKGKFVFVKREPEEVIRSKILAWVRKTEWDEMSELERTGFIGQLRDEVLDHYSVYDAFMEQNEGVGVVLKYEDLVASPYDLIDSTLEFLGLERGLFDFHTCDQVLNGEVSTTPKDTALAALIKAVM